MEAPSTPTPPPRPPSEPRVYIRDFFYRDRQPSVLPESMRAPRGNISRTSAKTFAELLSGATVDIYVGQERKHWSLHENLLCHHSSYFETEFQGHEVPNKEQLGSHKTLELPDDDPKGFELLVKWLYQGTLDDASHMTDEAKYDYAVACHKLYQLCDKFDMIHVKNLAMDAYRANLHSAQLVPDADEINEIYRASPRGSPFRKLMTEIAARQIMDPHVNKDAESYRVCFEGDPDFAVEMINAIRYLSGGILFDDPTEDDDCHKWHDHRDGSKCHLNDKTKAMISVENDQQPLPNSGARRRHVDILPLLAELSERPTPRKLDAQLPATPTTMNSAMKKSNPRADGPANGAATAKDSKAKSNHLTNGHTPRERGRRVQIDRGQDTIAGADQQGPAPSRKREVASFAAYPVSSIQPNGAQRRAVSSPQKLKSTSASPAKPRASTTGSSLSKSTRASSVSSEPTNRRSNHVNGIVRQYNGINGLTKNSRSSSLDDTSENSGKRPPPKLKRKPPG